MASINTGGTYAQSYGGGYIANRVRNDEKEKAPSAAESEKVSAELAQYKKDFVEKIRKLTEKPALANTRINLDIDNATFEKMRTDPTYEKKLLDLFQAKADKQYPLPPISITLTANDKGEDAVIDYGQSDDLFANRSMLRQMQRSLLRGGVESMREGVLSSLQQRFGAQSNVDLGSLSTKYPGLQDIDFYA